MVLQAENGIVTIGNWVYVTPFGECLRATKNLENIIFKKQTYYKEKKWNEKTINIYDNFILCGNTFSFQRNC